MCPARAQLPLQSRYQLRIGGAAAAETRTRATAVLTTSVPDAQEECAAGAPSDTRERGAVHGAVLGALGAASAVG